MRAWLFGSFLFLGVGLAVAAAQDEPDGKPPPQAATHNDWTRAALTAHRGVMTVRNREGGSGTDKPVRAALRWLLRHQHREGRWSGSTFKECCKKPDKPCRIRSEEALTDGRGWAGYDVGVTGLAVLAFTAGGHTHVEAGKDEYCDPLERAARWLISMQTDSDKASLDGFMGKNPAVESDIYNHALATQALAELLLGSGDQPLLQGPVERGLTYCLKSRNDGYAWRYQPGDGSNDTSVTGWLIQALHVGRACAEAGLVEIPVEEFGPAFAGAAQWLDRATSKLSGICGYQSPGDPGSVIRRDDGEFPFSKDLSSCTGVALLLRRLGGQSPSSEPVTRYVAVLQAQPPRWQERTDMRKSTINCYYWYYATHGMFQVGGTDWKKWNRGIKKVLRKNQRDSGCEAGSWDPVGEWGIAGGRPYATAINALTLQVYQRYARDETPQEEKPGDEPPKEDPGK